MTAILRRVRLADLVTLNPRLMKPLGLGDLVSFVPMASVDAVTGTVLTSEVRKYADVCKGYTPFEDGDVLIAKITPCFENGKLAQATISYPNGFGSTEFHVLRPRDGELDSRYLLHYLRQDKIRHAGERKMTGSAGQRRVPSHFLENLYLPLPPLDEQRRIAAVLDQAEVLRAKRREALATLDELTQVIFLDMFGDPTLNPKGWSLTTIGEVAQQVTDGEHLTPKRTTDGIRLLSARNIRDGYIDFSNVDFIGLTEHERIKRRCNPSFGDILISCSGTIGRVASVTICEPFSLVRSVALVRPNSEIVRPKFLEYLLRTPALKIQMLRRANSSSQANLFQRQIRELPVLIAPISRQDDFARRVEVVERLKVSHRAHLAELDALFASLQHRAFRGEL